MKETQKNRSQHLYLKQKNSSIKYNQIHNESAKAKSSLLDNVLLSKGFIVSKWKTSIIKVKNQKPIKNRINMI